MSVPGKVYELVERFDRNREDYKSGRFNEAQARVDFINPLFALLGWDVENRQGRPEAYREVVYEDRVKVGRCGRCLGHKRLLHSPRLRRARATTIRDTVMCEGSVRPPKNPGVKRP